MAPHPSQTSGFSLLELLVTVFVIAVLLLLAFPVSQHVVYSSRNTTCVSNLRTIGQAMLSYAGDHRGRLPSCIVFPLSEEAQEAMGTAGNDRLLMAVYPYLNKPEVYRCPVVMAGTKEAYLQDGRYRSTYNQNVYTFAASPGSIPSPSQTILIYEGLPHLNIAGTPPHHQMEAYPVSSIFSFHLSNHGNTRGMNALMVDGHVEANLYYVGWGDPRNTLPADGGIWGNNRWSFNL